MGMGMGRRQGVGILLGALSSGSSLHSSFGDTEPRGGVPSTLIPAFFILLHSHLLTLPFQSSFPSYFPFRSHKTLWTWGSQDLISWQVRDNGLVFQVCLLITDYGTLVLWDKRYYLKIRFCGQIHLGNAELNKYKPVYTKQVKWKSWLEDIAKSSVCFWALQISKKETEYAWFSNLFGRGNSLLGKSLRGYTLGNSQLAVWHEDGQII